MNLTVCKKVCNECPFKTKSIPGWLGPHSVQEIQNSIQFEGLFSCHKQRGQDTSEETMELILSGKQNICRGFILSATKSCKLFGQNSTTGSELRRLQKEVKEGNDDMDTILDKWNFKTHHEKYS